MFMVFPFNYKKTIYLSNYLENNIFKLLIYDICEELKAFGSNKISVVGVVGVKEISCKGSYIFLFFGLQNFSKKFFATNFSSAKILIDNKSENPKIIFEINFRYHLLIFILFWILLSYIYGIRERQVDYLAIIFFGLLMFLIHFVFYMDASRGFLKIIKKCLNQLDIGIEST